MLYTKKSLPDAPAQGHGVLLPTRRWTVRACGGPPLAAAGRRPVVVYAAGVLFLELCAGKNRADLSPEMSL